MKEEVQTDTKFSQYLKLNFPSYINVNILHSSFWLCAN